MGLEQDEIKLSVFYILIGLGVALFIGPTESFEFSLELLTRVNCKTTLNYIMYWMGFSSLICFEILLWPLHILIWLNAKGFLI